VGQLPSLKEKIEDGHLEEVSELVTQTKVLGAQLYTCTHSMGLLNIARDELVDKVDRSMGLTTFLAETADDQILFI
jgi:peroxiredoxin family protein